MVKPSYLRRKGKFSSVPMMVYLSAVANILKRQESAVNICCGYVDNLRQVTWKPSTKDGNSTRNPIL